MGLRFPVAFIVAFAVTFGLFWVMQALIGVEGALDDEASRRVVDFVRLKRDSETETKKRKLPDKKPPEEQPPPPDLNLSQNLNPDQDMGSVMPILDTSVDLAGGPSLGAAGADTNIVPLVRVAPHRGVGRGLVYDQYGGHGQESQGRRIPAEHHLQPSCAARDPQMEVQSEDRGRESSRAVRRGSTDIRTRGLMR